VAARGGPLMPRASILLVRLSLLWLVTGAVAGALMLAGKALPALAWSLALRPAHQDIMVAGWMLQLVLGVAFWILPRLPERSRTEGTPRVLVAAVLLNLGALTAAWAGVAGRPGPAAAGRAAQLLAVLLFASVLWRRVRPYGMTAGVSGRGGR